MKENIMYIMHGKDLVLTKQLNLQRTLTTDYNFYHNDFYHNIKRTINRIKQRSEFKIIRTIKMNC